MASELDLGREGELIDRKYRLEKRLGAGGMGEVYRAVNEVVGRPVAIKLLRPEHANNKIVVERFLREARAANLVRHPNVVDVLDLGVDEHQVPYIVQELLIGEDLGQLLQREGTLEWSHALSLLIPVVDAIGLAHQRGIVHRDLKPENIFLDNSNGTIVPKVLDFGISKITAPNLQKVTATGVTMGTPAYMSPEQIQAVELDARSDVWALGVILHELLSGDLPFRGETHGALFVQICTQPPIPLLSVAPNVPPALALVVGRCLRRSPEERYPTAAEMARDLRNLLEDRPVEPTRKLAAIRDDGPVPSAVTPAPRSEAITVAKKTPVEEAPETAKTAHAIPSMRTVDTRIGAPTMPRSVPPPAEKPEPAAASASAKNPVDSKHSNQRTPVPEPAALRSRSKSSALMVALAVLGVGVAAGGAALFRSQQNTTPTTHVTAQTTPPPPPVQRTTTTEQPPVTPPPVTPPPVVAAVPTTQTPADPVVTVPSAPRRTPVAQPRNQHARTTPQPHAPTETNTAAAPVRPANPPPTHTPPPPPPTTPEPGPRHRTNAATEYQ